MKEQYIQIETTMSELLLAFLDTEEGVEIYKRQIGENWEEELEKLRTQLCYDIQHPLDEDQIIITAEDNIHE